ncbi:MAG: glycosyltransferase family 4 protein [Brevundimonas sp.]|nr:glycosyltransferase family 4 protein [Brevundimonas sp.]
MSSLLPLTRPRSAPWPEVEVANDQRPKVRTAILMPSGSRFSAASPNSMETVVRTLAGPLADQEVRIFCCEGASDHEMEGVHTLPDGKDRLPILLAGLREFKPEVIEHHQQVKQALAVTRALPGVAHLLYRHNGLKTPASRFDAWRYTRRLNPLDGFVFVSEAERDLFRRDYPGLAAKALAAPNPIHATPWLASPERRERVIAFAGRAMPEKGVDVLCAALPAVLDRHPDWRVVLMLNDWKDHQAWAAPHVAPLERYGQRVTVLKSAPLAEVRVHMRTAAVALTPSVWAEPFCLAAVEAHAAGAALISSGTGGLREASGDHALYLDEVTPRTITDAINRLIADPEGRIAMARAAQAYVLATHTPERRAAGILRIRQAAADAKRQEKSPTRAPG